jgi:hypothetical protein
MNEKRLIQLINFHIDGEISPSQLEELEQEVAANSRHRETYQSYCRLQQASRLVYNQFGEALSETVDLKKYHILARNSSRGFQRGLLYSASALTAACVSVIAAVALFQDAEWGRSANDLMASDSGFGAVEIFEPGVLNRRSSPVRTAGLSPAFDSFSPFGVPRFTARAFQPASIPTVWEDEVRSSSARVIRGHHSFDAPELASFQFQR